MIFLMEPFENSAHPGLSPGKGCMLYLEKNELIEVILAGSQKESENLKDCRESSLQSFFCLLKQKRLSRTAFSVIESIKKEIHQDLILVQSKSL